MSIKDLIAAAYNKDATAFESAFQSVMQDKVSAAVENAFTAEETEEDLDEAKKSEEDDEDEEDEDEEDEDMKEEVDQIDELSDDKLKAYHAKAGADRQKAKETVTKNMNAKNPTVGGIDKATDAYKRFQKRGAGMTTAANKMSEESEQIDELSKKTLGSYVKKASDNAASKAVEYGTKKAQSDEMDRMMNRHMSYSDKDKVRGIMGTTSKDVNAPREKAAKRLAGIDRAVDKLSK